MIAIDIPAQDAFLRFPMLRRAVPFPFTHFAAVGLLLTSLGLVAAATAAQAALVGVDFDQSEGSAPVNWGQYSGGPTPVVLENLTDETGEPSPVVLSIEASDGDLDPDSVTPDPSTLPSHATSLEALDGSIFNLGEIRFLWEGLAPGEDYEVYVFALDSLGGSQNVTVQGAASEPPLEWSQVYASGQLFVNSELGDATRPLTSFAQVVIATDEGAIRITVDPPGFGALAGIAVRRVPEPSSALPAGAACLLGRLALQRRRARPA